MAKSKRIDNGVGMVADIPPVKGEGGKLTENQVSYIMDALRSLRNAINGRISFGNGVQSTQSGNIDGHTKEVYFKNANTDYMVPHGLGRLPIGIVVLNVNQDDAVVRAASSGSWTPTEMFVRCNVADTTALFVVV